VDKKTQSAQGKKKATLPKKEKKLLTNPLVGFFGFCGGHPAQKKIKKKNNQSWVPT